MITPDEALETLAGRLEVPIPAPDTKGARVFDLTEGMRLGVEILPGDAGLVAWSEAGTAEGRDAEERAAHFLRLRLARLRGTPIIEATCADGRLLLFWRGRPDTEREWLDAVAALLNEAEAMRRVSTIGDGARPALFSLYPGFAKKLGRP